MDTERPTYKGEVYLVRNLLQADILLPRPSLDGVPKEVLGVGRCMLADRFLIDALSGMIEVLGAKYPLPHGPCSYNTGTAERLSEIYSNPPIKNNNDEKQVFSAWWKAYGSTFQKVRLIAELAIDINPAWLDGLSISNHKSLIIAGRRLRSLVDQDLEEWKISLRLRSNTTEYSIAPKSL